MTPYSKSCVSLTPPPLTYDEGSLGAHPNCDLQRGLSPVVLQVGVCPRLQQLLHVAIVSVVTGHCQVEGGLVEVIDGIDVHTYQGLFKGGSRGGICPPLEHPCPTLAVR